MPEQVPPFDKIFGDTFDTLNDCSQWAVVTTIHKPNQSIIGVSNLQRWCLVIVADEITPDNDYDDLAKKDNAFYLSASNQKNYLLGSTSNFIKMMPFRSFAKKNIGFLFAMTYGARVIYDFDDDNVLTPLEDGTTVPPPFFYTEDVGFDKTVLLEFVKTQGSSQVILTLSSIHMSL